MQDKKSYKDGIYNITIAEYHNASAFSRTQLMTFDKSPYHFWYEHLSGLAIKKEPTEAMVIGSAIHTLLLEPELFEQQYAVLPKIDRRTTKGKEAYALFTIEYADKIILSHDQYALISAIKENVMKHDIMHTLLSDVQFEQSIFWTDEETGLQFKVRPDIWSNKMILDLKTAEDVTPNLFKSSAYKNGYYLQAGMMWEACRVLHKPFEVFGLLAIEKKEPHVPMLFLMKDNAIEFGWELFQNHKKRLKKCIEINKWPAYPVVELDVPAYATINDEEI